MKTPRIQIYLFLGMVLLVTLSCTVTIGGGPPRAEPATPAPLSPTALTAPTIPPIPTAPSEPTLAAPAEPPAATSSPAEQPAVSAVQPCQAEVCFFDLPGLLQRPIGPENRNEIDTASRYGTLRRRLRDVYRGVQFLNSTGTPVYAAATGDVEVAGDDSQVIYGSRPEMYGNLVILKHALPGFGVPIYTLYAHLSDVAVKAEGDAAAGQQIGQVGMSGSVAGSTLYFEVRYGQNEYMAAVNPELWLEPLLDESGDPLGALAGKIVDERGDYVPVRNIQVENLRTPTGIRLRPLYLRTYLDDDQWGLSPWGESFAAADLPEGTYQITFWEGPREYQREVEIQPGKLTFVNFVVK